MKTIFFLKFLTVFFVCLILSSMGIAQDDEIKELEYKLMLDIPDTARVNALLRLSMLNSKKEFEKSKKYANKALVLSKEINYSKGSIQSIINLGAFDYRQNKYARAIELFQQAKKIAEKELNAENKKDMTFFIGQALNNIGLVHWDLDNYERAIEYFQQSLKCREEVNDSIGIAKVYTNLGGLYIDAQEFDLAIQHIDKAIKIRSRLKDSIGIAHSYNNLGIMYMIQKMYSMALSHFQRALEIKEKLGDRYGMATSYNNLAEVYNMMADSARNNSTKKNYFLLAIKNAKEGIKISDEFNTPQRKRYSFEHLSHGYEGLGEFKTALMFYKQYQKAMEKHYNAEKQLQIEKLEAKYQSEKKQEQINNERKLYEEKLKRKDFIITAFIFGVAVILIILFLFYRLYKLKHISNKTLSYQYQQICQQNEEINSQTELLASTNKELEKHKTHLKQLVDEQTEELQVAKEKAEESSRLKSAFLANISHEIRTPLNAIIGFSDFLKDREIDIKTHDEMADQVMKSANGLLTMFDNIIELSKIETKQFEVRKYPVSIGRLFRELYLNYSDIASGKGLNLIIEKVPDNEEVKTDEYRIKQILKNLIENALKYTSSGSITVSYQNNIEESFFTIKVSDTGVGIHEKETQTIFERFTKATTNGNQLYRGAGIGLSICKLITDKMGGTIKLESNPGNGSSFYINLPN